jgi:8-oxo-dGTP pyrophosphatase MutT (NUDIX family)
MKQLDVGEETPQEMDAQYAALCYRLSGKAAHDVLLITSRDTGRWVIPKGWPMKGKTGAEAALLEAFEEAGVKGKLSCGPIGVYSYDKVLPKGVQPCIVTVYPVEVTQLIKDFPEQGQRDRKWFRPKKAAAKVDEPELRSLLTAFDPRKSGDAASA